MDIRADMGEYEIECPNCHKKFLSAIGIIRAKSGSPRTVSFGPPPYTLRMKMPDGEKAYFFNTDAVFDVRSGDRVALLFKKGFLSSKYSDKPNWIINFTLNHAFGIK